MYIVYSAAVPGRREAVGHGREHVQLDHRVPELRAAAGRVRRLQPPHQPRHREDHRQRVLRQRRSGNEDNQ